MSLYSLALFLHVVGALLLFVTLTIEGIALRQLRRAATVPEAKGAAAMLRLNRVVGPFSAFGVLVPGLYMTATSWGWVPWILVALVSWALIAVLGAVNGIRILALERTTVAEGAPSVMGRFLDPLFLVSWVTRFGIALGVIFLMTVKPGALVAVSAVVVAAAAGVALGVALGKRGGKGTDGPYAREGQLA
jgi:hypothetical protein